MLNSRSLSPTSQSQCFGSFSQLAVYHNTGPQSNAHLGIIPSAAEEFLKLKKEYRLKQAEYDKERAILLQKNEQLESQLTETAARQQAQVQMYESMINSLKTHDTTQASQIIVAQIAASERQGFEEEIQSLKEHRRRLMEEHSERDRDSNRQINDKDGYIKDLQLQVERMLFEKSQQLFQWEVERKEMQQRVQMVINDKDQAEAMFELRTQNRMSETLMDMERAKLDHMREIEKIKTEYETTFKELRIIHEQEKQGLESRLDRQSHDLKSLHHMVIQQDSATTDSKQSTKQHQEKLTFEIGNIQAEVDGIKHQYELTVAQVTQEKEIAEARNAKLQKQLEKLKNAPKQAAASVVKIDLPRASEVSKRDEQSEESMSSMQRQVRNLKQEVELLQSENEKLSDQVKRLRKDAIGMQEYADKLEDNEKKLRQVLKEQATVEQDQVVELRRQLNVEKKRGLEQSEIMSSAKETLERDNLRQATQLVDKEEQIRTITKELRTHERKVYDIQSMFNSQMPGNPLSMSCVVQDRQNNNHHQRQISVQDPQLYGLNNNGGAMQYVAQSQSNYSPRNLVPGNHYGSFLQNSTQQSFPQQLVMMPNANQISQLELQIQKQSQRMAESQPRVECQHCYQTLENQSYFEHMTQFHPHLQNNQIRRQQNDDQPEVSVLSTVINNQAYPSPRVMQSKQQFNSRSFTCLLKEIDEDEEKNIVGSVPGSKVGRIHAGSTLALVPEEESNMVGEKGGQRKSRNANKSAHGGLQKNGSTVIYSTTMNGPTVNSGQKTFNRQGNTVNSSTTSLASKLKIAADHQNSNSSSREKKPQKSQDKTKPVVNTNITNEIKDLLDKLVSYQGNSQGNAIVNNSQRGAQTLHSIASNNSGQQYSSSRPRNPMSTESMVELRSSTTSSVYIVGGENNKYSQDFKVHHTASRENKVKPRISTNKRKSNALPPSLPANKENKSSVISKQKKTVAKVVKVDDDLTNQFDEEENHDSFQSSPQRRQSSSRSLSSLGNSLEQETARHTSKDTLLNIPDRGHHGRRYHDVNKSDVLTPNSPRRYQEYFKNKLLPLGAGSQTMTSNYVGQCAPSQSTTLNINSHYQQNHRYSPSNTKSLADESQYNQMSPSPEKQIKSKVNLNEEQCMNIKTMPLQQQLQNNPNKIFTGSKLSSQGGHYPHSHLQQQNHFATYDSGSVLCGGASDIMFKTQTSGSHKTHHNLMIGGVGFGHGAASIKSGSIGVLKGPQYEHVMMLNNSLDEESDIRPSQIDEFIDKKAYKPDERGSGHISSSYISIGEEDPFLTGKFCDGTGKQFNFNKQGESFAQGSFKKK